jgi:methylisocitrate lyase
MDEALRRARLYKEAGADVLFVEGPRTLDELRTIGKELPRPLAVNLIEGGKTPMPSLEELKELGFFSVGFVLSGLYAAAWALEQTYREIRARGKTDDIRQRMLDFDAFGERIGLEQRYADDERFRVREAKASRP